MPSVQFRCAIFVLHPEGDDPEPYDLDIKTKIGTKDVVRYYCYQWERGGNSNRLHAQGFIMFHADAKQRLGAIKKHILHNDRVHVEAKYKDSTPFEAAAYAQKDATRVNGTAPVIWGEEPTCGQKGHRTDLDDAVDAIKDGIDEESFRDTFRGEAAKYSQYFKQLFGDQQQRVAKRRRVELEVIMYHGPPGSGKTRRVYDEVARDFGSEGQLFSVCPNGSALWYDGYVGQPVLLFDDMSSHWVRDRAMTLGHWLQVTDIYPVRLPIKGHHTWLAAARIYITSNQTYDEWWSDLSHNHLKAIRRRITHIEFVEHYQPPVVIAAAQPLPGDSDEE